MPNHTEPGQTPPWPMVARMALVPIGACKTTLSKVEKHCKTEDGKDNIKCPDSSTLDDAKAAFKLESDKGTGKSKAAKEALKQTKAYKDALKKQNKEHGNYAQAVENDDCQKAARCLLTPYSPHKCCPPQTPHHLVPKSQFYVKECGGTRMPGTGEYNANKAPCVCAEGGKSYATHGLLHDAHAQGLAKMKSNGVDLNLESAITLGAKSMHQVFPQCDEDGCIEAQLREGHKNAGVPEGANPELSWKSQKPGGSSEFKSFKTAWEKMKTFKAPTATGPA